MKKLMWALLGFVLVFAWGLSYAAERPEVTFLDDVTSGTTTQLGVEGTATGVSCVAVLSIDKGYETMILYPPTTVLFGKESIGAIGNASPGGTGITADSGATYYYAWSPLSSVQSSGDIDAVSDVTPFYHSDGSTIVYTVGGVSDVPSEPTDVPAAERVAVFFVTGCSQYQVPTTGEVVVK